MRKRATWILCIGLALALVLAGCAKPADSPSVAGTPQPVVTPMPIPTTAPDVAATPADEEEGIVLADGWTYYLDEDEIAVTDYGEDPRLCRKNESSVEDLGIRSFAFDIIGDYIYADSRYPDLDDKGNQAWYTTRMSLDGSGKRRLEYASMSARLMAEDGQHFYFTTAGESAVFVADLACENVTPLVVNLPDADELNKELDADRELQLDIESIESGRFKLSVTFVTPDGIQMYKGTYAMSLDGSAIEKKSGTYYDYKSLESALD
ncbi:MAG: hypothetical protein ACOX8N_01610 [Christensenellales bacterium]|jgi:hypothetical protein